MADGDQRLNSMFFIAVKNSVVKFQTFLVGFRLHPGWENTSPVDGSAKNLEAHLGEERNVVFVMMVKVNGLVTGVELIWQSGGRYPARACMGTIGTHIRDTGALAVCVPSQRRSFTGHDRKGAFYRQIQFFPYVQAEYADQFLSVCHPAAAAVS